MRGRARMPSAIRRLIRSERGMAVPMTLTIIAAGLSLAGAAILASVYTQNGASRDSDSKKALAAADAGGQVALLREDEIVTTSSLPCLVTGVGGGLAPGLAGPDGWCPAQTGTVAGTSYTYRVKPWSLIGTVQSGVRRQLLVVATGTSGSVNRRIELTATAKTGVNPFGGSGAVGRDRLTIAGSGDIGNLTDPTSGSTNGDIETQGSGLLCGDAHYGIGHSFIGGHQCAGYTQGPQSLSLPLVDPGNTWATNDDGRFFAQDTKKGSATWDAATRTLALGGNAQVTLGGANYSFCRLTMSGSSSLIVAQGAVVNIFFHSPETCGLSGNPVNQFDMTGNTKLLTTSQNPGDLRLMFVGSDSISTTVDMHGNSHDVFDFTMYGPRTDITLQGNPTYVGAIAGKTLTVAGSALVLQDNSSFGQDLSVGLNYHRDRYVECVGGVTPSPPDSSC